MPVSKNRKSHKSKVESRKAHIKQQKDTHMKKMQSWIKQLQEQTKQNLKAKNEEE